MSKLLSSSILEFYKTYKDNDVIIENSNIGFITKEYLREELEKEEIKELQLDIDIPKSEFGIYYIKDNKFKELSDLIKVIQHNF